MKKILVIDDDYTFCLMLQNYLSKQGFEVSTAGTASQALTILDKTSFDLILSDYRMPDKDGLVLLEEIKKRKYEVPIIIMTSYGDIRLAIRAIKLGAFNYLTKPIKPDELLELVKHALKSTPIKNDASNNTDTVYDFQFVEGVSKSWKKIDEYIKLVAPTFLSVIIQGESGTGKEFIARKLHQLSTRANKPFVAIDCGALSDEMSNSELFGHVIGSFTGAIADKQGCFELANGGTIFLDEIGNLSYSIQIKLLRAIQERTIRRTGGTKNIAVDVRIIVASNEDLQKAVQKGLFREDLYHRLNEFKIEADSLRNRKEDVIIFANYFLEQANKELGKNITGFDTEVLEKLLNYSWPGNLRELKNVIRRSALLTKENKINSTALPSEIVTSITTCLNMDTDTTNLKILAENMEKQSIISALQKTRYNKSRTAKLLNIDRKTLYNKLKNYNLDF
ncbi:MAG: sigma-54-dependent transcriptional regulator [Bacteroidia bacterium]